MTSDHLGIEYRVGCIFGGIAFARGIYAAALDGEALTYLATLSGAETTAFLRGWVSGNAEARLAA